MQYLSLMGYLPIRNNTGLIIVSGKDGSRRAIKAGTPGSPDIIACSPRGEFVAIECKSSKGKLSKKQADFIERINRLGGKAMVVRSIEELISNLKN